MNGNRLIDGLENLKNYHLPSPGSSGSSDYTSEFGGYKLRKPVLGKFIENDAYISSYELGKSEKVANNVICKQIKSILANPECRHELFVAGHYSHPATKVKCEMYWISSPGLRLLVGCGVIKLDPADGPLRAQAGQAVESVEAPPLEGEILSHDLEGVAVAQRAADGYVNATALCKAAGKLWKHYRANQQTQEFIAELSSVAGIPATELVQTTQGGDFRNQGTWVHPDLAVHLGMWLSPRFAVAVCCWVREWMAGDQLRALPSPHDALDHQERDLLVHYAKVIPHLQKRAAEADDAEEKLRLALSGGERVRFDALIALVRAHVLEIHKWRCVGWAKGSQMLGEYEALGIPVKEIIAEYDVARKHLNGSGEGLACS